MTVTPRRDTASLADAVCIGRALVINTFFTLGSAANFSISAV